LVVNPVVVGIGKRQIKVVVVIANRGLRFASPDQGFLIRDVLSF
jgi:hypothetical protein